MYLFSFLLLETKIEVLKIVYRKLSFIYSFLPKGERLIIALIAIKWYDNLQQSLFSINLKWFILILDLAFLKVIEDIATNLDNLFQYRIFFWRYFLYQLPGCMQGIEGENTNVLSSIYIQDRWNNSYVLCCKQYSFLLNILVWDQNMFSVKEICSCMKSI